ncbi:biotin/lipoyl-containing protein [Georgenia sp. Z1491]|uniref:biotin/lipoyl-containing protein n=1 Tax=Georgenia sp. Z1491 TaxID=3416707 RepID=UPI003CEE6634
MREVLFPRVDEDDPSAEGVVATWYSSDGEQVAEGQLIAEVQVAKVSVEVTAPAAGVLRVVAEEDAAVHQGDVIGRIEG